MFEKSEKNFNKEVILSLSVEEKSQGNVGVKYSKYHLGQFQVCTKWHRDLIRYGVITYIVFNLFLIRFSFPFLLNKCEDMGVDLLRTI